MKTDVTFQQVRLKEREENYRRSLNRRRRTSRPQRRGHWNCKNLGLEKDFNSLTRNDRTLRG